MERQAIESIKTITISSSTLIAAIWVYLKFFFNWFDTRIERKKKDIEILDQIIEFLPESLSAEKEAILKLISVEKFNAYHKTKFDFDTMKACLKTSNPQETIKVVKSYSGNIEIIDKKITPSRVFDDNNFQWKWLLRIYFFCVGLLALTGVIYPKLFSHNSELTSFEDIFIRMSYIGLIVFLLNALVKLNKAKKIINNIS